MRLLSGCSLVLLVLCGCFGEPAPAPPLPARPAPAPAAPEPDTRPKLAQDLSVAVAPEPSTKPLQLAADTDERPRKPERSGDPLLGELRCKFDDYPPMNCVVSKKGQNYWIEKTQGSQRIRGSLVKEGDGLVFQGEFFCPMGACTSSARATLRKTDRGWAGTILHDQDGYPMKTPLVLFR